MEKMTVKLKSIRMQQETSKFTNVQEKKQWQTTEQDMMDAVENRQL